MYAFDDIGNRIGTKAGGDASGADLRPADYNANNLNQYTSRTVPGAVDVMGVSYATNTVTVNGQTAYRKGEYFRKEVSAANSSAPVWQSITVAATGQTNVTGSTFVPKTPEASGYDLDGNLTNDGRWAYTWDAENRLVRMVARTSTGPQQRLDFGYDWRGRRISKKVWNNTGGTGSPNVDQLFTYDGWKLMATLNPQLSTLNSFVWGLDLSGSLQGAGGVGGLLWMNDASSSSTHLASFDGNGNVVALFNATDTSESARYEYGPFAELLRTTGPACGLNPFRFSTKYHDDETDLLYYGYRYLRDGTWLSRDPIDEDGGLNLYAFVGNDPVISWDFLGQARMNLPQMQALLATSSMRFLNQLTALCPICPVKWTDDRGHEQICDPQICRLTALLMTIDFASHLRATFTAQHKRFGNVLAFTSWHDSETINDRADRAPGNGNQSSDFLAGYGLKCTGMQELMMDRFFEVTLPARTARSQCFKGALFHRHAVWMWRAAHNWFAIYGPLNNDLRKPDITVDPWHSAGGIISKQGSYGHVDEIKPKLW